MAVDDECKLKFLELKAKRTHRFIIYKIDDKKKMVVVEKVGEPALNYEDFAASLPTNECRYAIFDYDFVTEENCQKSKIFFVAWSVMPPICSSIHRSLFTTRNCVVTTDSF